MMILPEKSGRISKKISFLPFIVFAFLVILALSDKWGWDEATTYLSVSDNSPLGIISYSKFNLANNHVINSLYCYVLAQWDVKLLFLYRLPNLLSFFVYFYFISRLLKSEEGYERRHADQLALYIWPICIYFANARGYGLGMAGFAATLWYFKEYLKKGTYKTLFAFTLLSIFCCVNLFSFLFPIAAMVIIIVVKRFRQLVSHPLNWIILILFLPAILYVYSKGQIVSKYDEFIIGSDSFFNGGTLSSLLSFLALMNFAPLWLFFILKALLVGSLIPVVYILIRRRRLYIELSVFFLTLLLMVLARWLTGAMYPLARSAAYLILLVYLSIAYSNFRKNTFYTIHFFLVILSGTIYLGIIANYQLQKSEHDVLTVVAKKPSLLVIQDMEPSANAINHMYFNDSLQIYNLPYQQTKVMDILLDTVNYVICKPYIMDRARQKDDFLPVYDVASFFFFYKRFYIRKQIKE